MELLLKDKVEKLGFPGQVVKVKPGYARNFLLPQGLAIMVTRENRKSIEKEIEKFKVQEKKRIQDLEELAARIVVAKCTVAVQADESDKLYGSVTQEDIARALKLSDLDVNPKIIKIKKPIKSIGVHEIKVQLDKAVSADLKVWVVKE